MKKFAAAVLILSALAAYMAVKTVLGFMPAVFPAAHSQILCPDSIPFCDATIPPLLGHTHTGGSGGHGGEHGGLGPPPSLDGSCANSNHVGASGTCILTTTGTNDIIVVAAIMECGANGVGCGSITNVSAPGLTFTQRATQQNSSAGTTAVTMAEWTAPASVPLAAVTMTATFNAAPDGWSMVAFGVNGAGGSFDSNASLPGLSYPSSGNHPGATISTTGQHDFIYVIFGGDVGLGDVSGNQPAGFTFIKNSDQSGGSRSSGVGAAFQKVTSAQTNITPAWGYSAGNGGQFTDAFKSN